MKKLGKHNDRQITSVEMFVTCDCASNCGCPCNDCSDVNCKGWQSQQNDYRNDMTSDTSSARSNAINNIEKWT